MIGKMLKIKYCKLNTYPKTIVTSGNLCQKIYLYFRGYKPHHTLFGGAMIKSQSEKLCEYCGSWLVGEGIHLRDCPNNTEDENDETIRKIERYLAASN